MTSMRDWQAESFNWSVEGAVAVISLNRPSRKNPLSFESYAELRDTFRALAYARDIHAVVFTSNDGNFCSGGDVHEIIGPLVEKDIQGLLEFTRMTGDLVKAMLNCGKPIIAAIDGSVQAPARSSPWRRTCVTRHPTLKQRFCLHV